MNADGEAVTSGAVNTNPAGEGEVASLAYAWFVVAVLCIAGIVSYIDRQVINLLIEPIKADFGINDTQIGLLQGFSFAVFYAILAIPLARLSDSGKRTRIIFWGVICWSIATLSCGLAGSFAFLFAARMFVGVGEATLTPAGYSLITDYFPKAKVALAISIFTGSGFVGSGIAYVFGGAIIEYYSSLEQIVLPFFGERSVWQATFITVAVPSVLVLVLLAFVREPPRQETVHTAIGGDTSVLAVMRYLNSHRRLFVGVLLGLTLMAAATYAINLWVPTYFIRVHGWTPMEIGSVFGVMVVVASGGGVFAGGAIATLWMRRGRDDANLRVPIISALCAIPFAISFPLMQDPHMSLVLLAPLLFLCAVPFGCGTAVLPIISPNRFRAQVVAIYLLIANLIAFTCGPTSVGVLTDYVFRDPKAIGYSMAISPALFILAGCVLVATALKPYGQITRDNQDA
ncbi:MAG: spinster family MFS transporter [Congregibacter sp.]